MHATRMMLAPLAMLALAMLVTPVEATSSARSAAASSGGGRRSTQVGGYAPETCPTGRQHQLQPPKQAAPTLHSAHSACWIYVKTDMSGLAIYRPSSSAL